MPIYSYFLVNDTLPLSGGQRVHVFGVAVCHVDFNAPLVDLAGEDLAVKAVAHEYWAKTVQR